MQDQDDAKSREHLIQMAPIVKMAKYQNFQNEAEGEGRRHGEQQPGKKTAGELGEGDGEIGTNHILHAMGEIDEVHHPKHQRQPRRHQKQQDAELQPIQRLNNQQITHVRTPDSVDLVLGRGFRCMSAERGDQACKFLAVRRRLPTRRAGCPLTSESRGHPKCMFRCGRIKRAAQSEKKSAIAPRSSSRCSRIDGENHGRSSPFLHQTPPKLKPMVHATLGIRPPAEIGGARLGLPGSHGPDHDHDEGCLTKS